MLKTVHGVFKKKLLQLGKNSIKQNGLFGIFQAHRFKSTTKSVYLIDETDSSEPFRNVSKYTNRTFTCGDLTLENVGERVTLCGWLEYQRMKTKFVILRDSYGQTQLLLSDADTKNQQLLEKLPLESILQVNGTVLSRPKHQQNANQATGDIEVLVEDVQVLNPAQTNLPFNIRDFQKAKEALRMQYRYLDLRFPQMQRNLRVRSELLMKMREFLVNQAGFVDVETPTLFRATPGGAQEFIVPTRFPGEFYSLVQSPQQFKQMLMAGAVDRYFQIARCYRDEGARPDRQPEFTQLDVEMSFTSRDGILALVEDLLGHSLADALPKAFPRMAYKEAVAKYGSDQPDTRFEFLLEDCTEIMGKSDKLVDCDDFGAFGVVFPSQFANLSRQFKDHVRDLGTKYTNSKFIAIKVKNSNDFISKLEKGLTQPICEQLSAFLRIEEDESVIFLSYGKKADAASLLGKVRVDYADHLESLGVTIRKKGLHFLWITDFPLFEASDTGKLQSSHHPFTSPTPESISQLDTDPLAVCSQSFDLVLNGNEIGGGSVRIHSPKLQQKIFEMLEINADSMQHMIDMLGAGCPPHGGIALGLDRLMAKILATKSIRDVIAFPKTFQGRDPLSGAPSKVSEADKKLYHIKTID